MKTVNALLDQAHAPDEAQLRVALGPVWPFFEAVRARAQGCEQDWKNHGKKYGWKLKIHAEDKNLCEVTVVEAGFLVTMAVREKERQALAADPALAGLAGGGAKASEGYGIRVEVYDQASCDRATALLGFIVAQRELEDAAE